MRAGGGQGVLVDIGVDVVVVQGHDENDHDEHGVTRVMTNHQRPVAKGHQRAATENGGACAVGPQSSSEGSEQQVSRYKFYKREL